MLNSYIITRNRSSSFCLVVLMLFNVPVSSYGHVIMVASDFEGLQLDSDMNGTNRPAIQHHPSKQQSIMLTCPCIVYPLMPHFYIVKLGFTGVYIFLIFALKHRLWVLVRTDEAVLPCTNNLCFRAKIRKKYVYPCKPQFYYLKVGCEGVFIIRTCLHDVTTFPGQAQAF